MGRKQLKPKNVAQNQKPTEEEVKVAAMAWAEFLYEEYCREKQNQLILERKCSTIKKLTNHDKLNS